MAFGTVALSVDADRVDRAVDIVAEVAGRGARAHAGGAAALDHALALGPELKVEGLS